MRPSGESSPGGGTLECSKAADGPRGGRSQSAKIKVPSAVGKDYQSAQDLWRGLGLVVGVAKDATGAHRIPILDSNWVVVSQEPAAGTEVAQGTVITATVKKYSDD